MKTINRDNRHLLPTSFLVKANLSHPYWVEYIKFINEVGNSVWGGDSETLHYGLHENRGKATRLDEEPYILYEILELDNVLEILMGEKTEIEMVETYNGETHPVHLCLQLHEDSQNSCEWALRSDATYSTLDEGWGLHDEVYSTVSGDTFLENNQDYHDISWSEYEGNYICTSDDDVYYGYVCCGRGTTEDYFISDDAICVEDNWYCDDEALRRNDYIYSERQDCWVHCDNWESGYHDWEEDESEANNAEYHHLTRVNKFDSSAKFTIGFEIEKEDSDMVSTCYDDLYQTTKWIKERDGSLDDSIGYELVSPAFNLYDDMLDKDIENNRILRDLINADRSCRCGGHINIGSTIYNTHQLFEGLSGFFPLLYAMYEGRLDQSYSKAKKKHEYYQRDKYSSIYIKDHVVEIRIPSAVVSVENLLWRRDLIRIMIDNINKSELQILRMLLNDKSKLHIHLRKVYSLDKVVDKIKKFVKYSDQFNNKKLPNANTSRLENRKANESKLQETLPMAC